MFSLSRLVLWSDFRGVFHSLIEPRKEDSPYLLVRLAVAHVVDEQHSVTVVVNLEFKHYLIFRVCRQPIQKPSFTTWSPFARSHSSILTVRPPSMCTACICAFCNFPFSRKAQKVAHHGQKWQNRAHHSRWLTGRRRRSGTSRG